MVKPKKKSKRMTCHKKYKIMKKVREHHKKIRKDEKTKTRKKSKKDPGIPNMFPFKEQVLRQIEERKQRAEEEKQRRKEQRNKELSKRRKLEDLQKNAERRAKEYEKKKSLNKEITKKGESVENSMRSYYKEFKKVVEAADVVVEVLDARDPMGCRCLQLEEMVMASGTNKRIVLLLNKIDLVPKDIVEKWLQYLRNEFPTLAFKASTQSQRQKLKQSKIPVTLASADLLDTSSCIGAGTLLKLLGNYCRNKDIKTAITVGIVGFPNVGKSSVINSLKRSKACIVGGTPGVTKSLQEVQLDKHVKLLDSPGIVMPTGSTDTQIILRNCVKVEQLDDMMAPVHALLKRCNKFQMMEMYNLPEYKDTQEFLYQLAKRLGKLKKGGIPDVNAAAKAILQDWNSGKITFYTHPPERKVDEKHESASVVQYLASEFDLDALKREEEDDLKDLVASLGSALVLEPGKPCNMETEAVEVDDAEDESLEGSEEEEIEEDSDQEPMVDDDDDACITQDLVVVASKKTTNEKQKAECEKISQGGENVQVNQARKKAYKQMKKDKKKEEARLLSKTEESMTIDDSDEDTYNFDAALD